ncbi:thiosulfate sulfurtransferase [Siccirubricoccus sp. KC 17139]|uniref:Thiosulfate sulfurtransferase n=1 Tax=Siccirubricoccus soli TaxID=2899147 RepID=A0ABT1D360_9PROT|nr:rhodanese-like domain-containing protein [Siccirubricoccus soli]MCO6416361.1 thiosulfate sulfurtransferase [Siccirubricoccus soli]MCP2682495.1 rhodanese-like domain-containing protein [Siccirubricoccus soli]
MRSIDAPTLKSWIHDGRELAILDAREVGEFGRSHLFWANPCPLSQAELRARAILPCRSTRIACVDGGEGGLAARLATWLERVGYTDVSVLEGGTPAWEAAGYVLFSGVNVPSKAFGEWVEHHYHTPSIDPAELDAMRRGGTDMVILDSRPMEEFRRMSIPGATCVPGGELVYRIGELAPDPATTIVVNCAGRTRSIMGAESLRSAGVPNKVVALRNGTMGWELAGFTCDRGKALSYPEGTPASLPVALERAQAFADRHGVKPLDRAGLVALLAETGRTTLVLDVRDPAEYAAGHLPGSRNAPGGQLVQATDQWVAVRGARIVLVDDTGVRARMAGGWLRQLGQWEVFVLEGGLQGALETGTPAPDCPEVAAVDAPSVTPATLAAALEKGGTKVVQLTRSLDFREAAIPGALWGVRTRLAGLAPALAGAAQVVVAAAEPVTGRLAVPELRGLTAAPVLLLEGGLAAWKEAGLPLVVDRRNPEDAACIDVYLRPYDRNEGVEEAMREYLSWEIDLVHEVARDGDARFGAA